MRNFKFILVYLGLAGVIFLIIQVFFTPDPKNQPCKEIVDDVIKLSKKQDDNFKKIEHVEFTGKHLPKNVVMPGELMFSCKGIAINDDSSATNIYFYKSKVKVFDLYVGYEYY